MATNLASNVALSFGLITASVAVQAALEPKGRTGNVLVCDAGHDPTQIRSPRVCSSCADLHGTSGEVPSQQLKRARPVEGGLVVLEQDEIATAAADAAKFKKRAAVTAHPSEQVMVHTSTGEKMYFLTPMAGHEDAYTTLRALVANHPELAFMTQWTPRTAMGQYQLLVHDGVLCFQERVEGAGNVRQAPTIDAEDNAALIGLAEQVLAMPASVADYDPVTYRDTYEDRIASIIAGKDVVQVAGASTAGAVAPVADLMAKLAAQVEATPAPKVKKPRAAKKVA